MSLDSILVFLAVSNLLLLGTSRIRMCIRTVAIQGVMLGLLPLLASPDGLLLRPLLVTIIVVVLKGGVFPWLLSRTAREVGTPREVEPLLGYPLSLALGTLAWIAAYGLSARLSLPDPQISPLVMPVALSTLLSGLLLIISRRKALMQILGFIVLENGIYAFGIGLKIDAPFLVEMGIFLDVFVAVFVMGIAIFHIHREFDHIDTDQLSALKH